MKFVVSCTLELASPPPLERPIVLYAKAFIPCNTLVLGWGDTAGIKLANTIDYYLVGVPASAGFADLGDHGVWLMKRRGRNPDGQAPHFLKLFAFCTATVWAFRCATCSVER